MNELSECDVLVVQRMLAKSNQKFLSSARRMGIKIVYDLDDNLWNIPRFNPAHAMWSSASAQEGIAACVAWADIITVSTRHLRNAVLDKIGHIKNVASGKPIPVEVIENRVDLKVFGQPLWENDSDKVVIGWGGSNTHYGDLDVIWKAVPAILDKYPNAHFELVGHEPTPELSQHPRVRVREWCHISEYAKRFATWNWDIVLAPLSVNAFNKSKSNIKMQEAAAIRKPCLAQNISSYADFCQYNKKLSWLLFSQPWHFVDKLGQLIESKSMRLDYGAMMYENVLNHYTIDRSVDQWQSICLSAYSS